MNQYAVEIDTPENGPVISRTMLTLRQARSYAAWCARTWPTRIMRGGAGGEEVESWPLRSPCLNEQCGCHA